MKSCFRTSPRCKPVGVLAPKTPNHAVIISDIDTRSNAYRVYVERCIEAEAANTTVTRDGTSPPDEEG